MWQNSELKLEVNKNIVRTNILKLVLKCWGTEGPIHICIYLIQDMAFPFRKKFGRRKILVEDSSATTCDLYSREHAEGFQSFYTIGSEKTVQYFYKKKFTVLQMPVT